MMAWQIYWNLSGDEEEWEPLTYEHMDGLLCIFPTRERAREGMRNIRSGFPHRDVARPPQLAIVKVSLMVHPECWGS